MLAHEVTALAQSAYDSQRTFARLAFAEDLRRRNAEFAARGIVGGPVFADMLRAGEGLVLEQQAFAAAELERSATSHGVRAKRDLSSELLSAFDEIVNNDWEWARSAVLGEAAPHVSNREVAQAECDAWLRGMASEGRSAAQTSFGHFAAKQKTAARHTREELLIRGAFGLGGAIVGALATYFIHH